MSKKKFFLIILLFFVCVFGYVFLLGLPPEYKTRNECEQKTGKICLHPRDFGKYMSQPGIFNLIKEKWCLIQMPKNWAPAKYFPSCIWPNE